MLLFTSSFSFDIFKKGISNEENKDLVEKYDIPENCGFIAAPVLNSEVIAAIQENVKTRDKRITEKQERIAACMAANGKAISITLKSDSPDKLERLEIESDMGRLLAFLQREESEIRKSLILANLNSSVREILTGSTVDGFQFGENLEEKIKTAKTIERTSKDLIQREKPSKFKDSKNQRGPPAKRQLMHKRNWTSSGPKKPTNDKFGPRPKKTYPRKTRFPDRRR
ncbi:uncharacterized protein LOC124293746 [Neodiprion lecontei]|uniref:Uncharacterized protein LOC124293746 n=1 Tax=Neodiprion lecontei TaxID=441921 RepID=A0ABM3FV87_NEOLC|nr:uncharacterized protein LOC124293746 [Neodiprion lecontei]